MSSFSTSQIVLSNGVRRAGIQSVWPYYYNPNDLLKKIVSEDFSSHRAVVEIQMRKVSESRGFFYNDL